MGVYSICDRIGDRRYMSLWRGRVEGQNWWSWVEGSDMRGCVWMLATGVYAVDVGDRNIYEPVEDENWWSWEEGIAQGITRRPQLAVSLAYGISGNVSTITGCGLGHITIICFFVVVSDLCRFYVWG
jgi:hypothetical protein